ncbi:MAG TPA: class I SAM-dependent methyltransferase [Terriglobales bacterium]|nr:class I SAM-dependent methyltransferase [Terriglobales bacterium]
MYNIYSYTRMIADELRSGAYYQALKASITPESVVVDLGAGVGFWGLVALELGARQVYALDFSHLLHVGKQIAAAHGWEQRIEFIQDFSTNVTLPERADVIIFDLHNELPFCHNGPAAIMDARDRMLKPGGALIPFRERVYGVLVESAAAYADTVGFWEKPHYGLDMSAGRPFATDWIYTRRFAPDELLSDRALYTELDYRTLTDPNASATVRFTAQRAGTAHGMQLWFESEMGAGARIVNAPGAPETIFQAAFIPWPEPVAMLAGDRAEIKLNMKNWKYEYLFECNCTFLSAEGSAKAEFRQSSLRHALPRLVGSRAEVL